MASSLSADEALERLREGNERFRAGKSRLRSMRPEELAKLAKGQEPFATIIGCSDSRVPPELIFDAVVGELFVIRIAGNVLSSEIAGSLQYAGAHLRTPLFIVLGHSGCGAVHAALDYRFRGKTEPSHIQVLVDSIQPALVSIDEAMSPRQQLAAAVKENVRWTMRQIMESVTRERVASGDFRLEGAVYDMSTGKVRLLPKQEPGGRAT